MNFTCINLLLNDLDQSSHIKLYCFADNFSVTTLKLFKEIFKNDW